MRKALTVKQVNQYLRTSIRQDPIFSNLLVVGEVANLRPAHDHLYFSLKEDSEVVDCVIYYYRDFDFEFSEGEKVQVKGTLTYYSYSSRIVISVKDLEKGGRSDSYLEFLKLRDDFEKRGYFDQEEKKEIPKFPKKIGLITSKEGAAIDDFLNMAGQGPSDIRVFLYPVKVQGQGAVEDIIRALTVLSDRSCDLLVLTRGGGSNEDLGIFNDKDLVEKIHSLKVPIISAIGHRRDISLTDLVSDLSLQTPTEAGRVVAEGYLESLRQLDILMAKMKKEVLGTIEKRQMSLVFNKKYLDTFSPENFIKSRQKDLNDLFGRFTKQIWTSYGDRRKDLNSQKQRLKSIGDLLDLEKKRIFIRDKEGKEIFSKYSLKQGQDIRIVFSDGEIGAEIKDGNE